MGGGQSAPEAGGFRIFKVNAGSPAFEAGLEVFFDFIIEINGVKVDSDQGAFFEKIKASENQRTKLVVYNIRTHSYRDATVTPRKWGGSGLLGAVVRYDSLENTENQGIRVLEVFPNSPSAIAGLVPFKDFLLGTADVMFRDIDELVEIVQLCLGKRMQIYVYNCDAETIREVYMVPNTSWGGDGAIGCDIRSGLLHRIPPPRRVFAGFASAAGVQQAAAAPPGMPPLQSQVAAAPPQTAAAHPPLPPGAAAPPPFLAAASAAAPVGDGVALGGVSGYATGVASSPPQPVQLPVDAREQNALPSTPAGVLPQQVVSAPALPMTPLQGSVAGVTAVPMPAMGSAPGGLPGGQLLVESHSPQRAVAPLTPSIPRVPPSTPMNANDAAEMDPSIALMSPGTVHIPHDLATRTPVPSSLDGTLVPGVIYETS